MLRQKLVESRCPGGIVAEYAAGAFQRLGRCADLEHPAMEGRIVAVSVTLVFFPTLSL